MLCSHQFIFIVIQNSGGLPSYSWTEETVLHVGMQKNYILLQVYLWMLNTFFLICIAAPCILIFTQFIHQQMHIY